MSLLPQQIPPQVAELGTVQIGEDGKPTGKVIMDVNWWLFFYNIAKQTLSAPGTPIPVSTTATTINLGDDDLVPPNPQPSTVIDWMSPT